MSRIVIVILIYHRHKPIDHNYMLTCNPERLHVTQPCVVGGTGLQDVSMPTVRQFTHYYINTCCWRAFILSAYHFILHFETYEYNRSPSDINGSLIFLYACFSDINCPSFVPYLLPFHCYRMMRRGSLSLKYPIVKPSPGYIVLQNILGCM
jgi:hypothetical protein